MYKKLLSTIVSASLVLSSIVPAAFAGTDDHLTSTNKMSTCTTKLELLKTTIPALKDLTNDQCVGENKHIYWKEIPEKILLDHYNEENASNAVTQDEKKADTPAAAPALTDIQVKLQPYVGLLEIHKAEALKKNQAYNTTTHRYYTLWTDGINGVYSPNEFFIYRVNKLDESKNDWAYLATDAKQQIDVTAGDGTQKMHVTGLFEAVSTADLRWYIEAAGMRADQDNKPFTFQESLYYYLPVSSISAKAILLDQAKNANADLIHYLKHDRNVRMNAPFFVEGSDVQYRLPTNIGWCRDGDVAWYCGDVLIKRVYAKKARNFYTEQIKLRFPSEDSGSIIEDGDGNKYGLIDLFGPDMIIEQFLQNAKKNSLEELFQSWGIKYEVVKKYDPKIAALKFDEFPQSLYYKSNPTGTAAVTASPSPVVTATPTPAPTPIKTILKAINNPNVYYEIEGGTPIEVKGSDNKIYSTRVGDLVVKRFDGQKDSSGVLLFDFVNMKTSTNGEITFINNNTSTNYLVEHFFTVTESSSNELFMEHMYQYIKKDPQFNTVSALKRYVELHAPAHLHSVTNQPLALAGLIPTKQAPVALDKTILVTPDPSLNLIPRGTTSDFQLIELTRTSDNLKQSYQVNRYKNNVVHIVRMHDTDPALHESIYLYAKDDMIVASNVRKIKFDMMKDLFTDSFNNLENQISKLEIGGHPSGYYNAFQAKMMALFPFAVLSGFSNPITKKDPYNIFLYPEIELRTSSNFEAADGSLYRIMLTKQTVVNPSKELISGLVQIKQIDPKTKKDISSIYLNIPESGFVMKKEGYTLPMFFTKMGIVDYVNGTTSKTLKEAGELYFGEVLSDDKGKLMSSLLKTTTGGGLKKQDPSPSPIPQKTESPKTNKVKLDVTPAPAVKTAAPAVKPVVSIAPNAQASSAPAVKIVNQAAVDRKAGNEVLKKSDVPFESGFFTGTSTKTYEQDRLKEAEKATQKAKNDLARVQKEADQAKKDAEKRGGRGGQVKESLDKKIDNKTKEAEALKKIADNKAKEEAAAKIRADKEKTKAAEAAKAKSKSLSTSKIDTGSMMFR